jgi:preprotein translocase subunit SecG
MVFIVGILTFVMVLNALLLILLVLVQLPKKDAGAGMAFGAGTADALFGAGSGNALTKITKYATVAFMLMALLLGYLNEKAHSNNSAADFAKQVQLKQNQPPALQTPPAQTPPATTPSAAPSVNNLLSTLPAATNAPASK